MNSTDLSSTVYLLLLQRNWLARKKRKGYLISMRLSGRPSASSLSIYTTIGKLNPTIENLLNCPTCTALSILPVKRVRWYSSGRNRTEKSQLSHQKLGFPPLPLNFAPDGPRIFDWKGLRVTNPSQ